MMNFYKQANCKFKFQNQRMYTKCLVANNNWDIGNKQTTQTNLPINIHIYKIYIHKKMSISNWEFMKKN